MSVYPDFSNFKIKFLAMELHVINTGFFKLDGGAMFGVVPKALWNKLNPADENNMCTWAMRCLLIEHEGRKILIDNGIGDKQDAKFFSHFYLHGDDSLEKSLHAVDTDFKDITDVFLTHLHFDHCGGSVAYDKEGELQLVFPEARYWSNKKHWDWAVHPNPREKASFLKENILPIEERGHLNLIDREGESPLPGISVLFADGHTEKQMVPSFMYKGKRIVFCADLLPSIHHIPMPYVMSYDVRPLVTMEEKALFLKRAADEKWILFLEHDPVNECCTVKHTEKGVRVDETFALKDIL